MKAAILHSFDAAPRYGDFERPEPRAGESLVKVLAAGIKQIDRGIARGAHYASPKQLPVVCGTDGVGLLESGQRVYFAAMRSPFGGMAEHSVASWHVPVPDALDSNTAAALVNPALGAWLPLSWRAKMEPGESVLVIGATGATGRLTVRIARILGASRVVAAGRLKSGLADVGADAIVDTEQAPEALRQAFADAAGERGFDVVVDYLWGPPAEALIAGLTRRDLAVSRAGAGRGVRLVSVGEMAGKDIRLPSAVLRSSHLQILGSGTGNFPPLPVLQETVARIFAEGVKGALEVDAHAVPLSAVEQVWNDPALRRRRLVLDPAA
jgi:NADPH:quinone reductase-like Zn-dependent oxidoreductase